MTDHRQAAIDAAARVHHKLHCSPCRLWPHIDCGKGLELDVAAVRMILDAAASADSVRADVPAPGAAMTMREIRAALDRKPTPEGDPS